MELLTWKSATKSHLVLGSLAFNLKQWMTWNELGNTHGYIQTKINNNFYAGVCNCKCVKHCEQALWLIILHLQNRRYSLYHYSSCSVWFPGDVGLFVDISKGNARIAICFYTSSSVHRVMECICGRKYRRYNTEIATSDFEWNTALSTCILYMTKLWALCLHALFSAIQSIQTLPSAASCISRCSSEERWNC